MRMLAADFIVTTRGGPIMMSCTGRDFGYDVMYWEGFWQSVLGCL